MYHSDEEGEPPSMSTDLRAPVRERDVRSLVRLVAEIAVQPMPGHDRASQLAEHLAELCDADAWVWIAADAAAGETRSGSLTVLGSVSTPRTVRDAFARLLTPGTHNDPGGPQDPSAHPPPQGHNLHASAESDRGTRSVLALHRSDARGPFEPETAGMVALAADACRELFDRPAPNPPSRRPNLSHRQRAVLAVMLDGSGRHAIAERLGISHHTAADHIKQIYNRFGVTSHRALIRACMADAPIEVVTHTLGDSDQPEGL